MKKALFLAAAIAATLAACNQGKAPSPTEPAAPAAEAGAPADAPADEAGDQGNAKVDLAQIEATGKTGIWAEPAGVCAQGSKDGVMITWNVKASGAEKVDVNVVTKEGDERNFGKSGPVGAKASGRWVRPGRIFKIRDSASGQELGSLTIQDAAC
jgi:hypothetical protein